MELRKRAKKSDVNGNKKKVLSNVPSASSGSAKSGDLHRKPSGVVQGTSQILLSQWIWILGLVFSGCCSNVFVLEGIVSEHPNAGTLVTFCQFLLVSIEGYINFFDSQSRFFLRKPKIPWYRWILPVGLFFAVSVLNNHVWIYNISVPVHIIFRSGGTVTTMIVGYLVGKRYTMRQVLGVATLSVGVFVATLYGTSGGEGLVLKDESLETQSVFSLSAQNIKFWTGIAELALAAVLTAFQGLAAESLYSKYGCHWRESLFYTHFFSLLFFFPIKNDLLREFRALATSEPKYNLFGVLVSRQLVNLALNALTQYVCVRGVHNLAGQVSALTVTIVLNIRKFISLLISVYMFGNEFSEGMITGTVLVFLGAFLYSW